MQAGLSDAGPSVATILVERPTTCCLARAACLTAPMARAESVRSLFAYLHASPSPYHAVANAVARLEEAGFRRLDEREPWPDVSGGRFVERGGALVAWRSPADATATAGFRIVGAHTDSPNLRIKPHPDTGNAAGGSWRSRSTAARS